MRLATLSADYIAFNKGAIMRRAYEIGRFALHLGRARREPASEINRTLSRSLTPSQPLEASHMANAPLSLLDAVNHLHQTILLSEAASMATHAIECDAHRTALGSAIDNVTDRLREMDGCLGGLLRSSREEQAHG